VLVVYKHARERDEKWKQIENLLLLL
jgi:hypothetical protein